MIPAETQFATVLVGSRIEPCGLDSNWCRYDVYFLIIGHVTPPERSWSLLRPARRQEWRHREVKWHTDIRHQTEGQTTCGFARSSWSPYGTPSLRWTWISAEKSPNPSWRYVSLGFSNKFLYKLQISKRRTRLVAVNQTTKQKAGRKKCTRVHQNCWSINMLFACGVIENTNLLSNPNYFYFSDALEVFLIVAWFHIISRN